MKIIKVPLRISFFSGGTDLPEFYHIEKGAALSVTINKYIYVVVHKTDDKRIHFSFSEAAEKVDDISKMEHIITKEVLKHFDITEALTITSISDIKCRGTGLGASSAYTVALINAIDYLLPEKKAAELAADIEINRCGFHIGKQDQYAASFGGANLFEFLPNDNVKVNRLVIDRDVDRNLFLVDTGIERHASTILQNFKSNITNKEVFNATKKQRDLAYRAVKMLEGQHFDDFGQLLDISWQYKKEINSSTTTSKIDEIYDTLKKAGALGGKICGAGGGGYMLFYVPTGQHSSFRAAVRKAKLEIVPFSFVLTGARMVFNDE